MYRHWREAMDSAEVGACSTSATPRPTTGASRRCCCTRRSRTSTPPTRRRSTSSGSSDWAEMFTDDAFYVVISRENADRGMPVGLIYCENKGMIHDRAFALKNTAMFAPRYLRHIVGNLQVLGAEPNGEIRARANYVVRAGAVRPARRQAAPGRRLPRQVPPGRRPAPARRAPLRVRQPAGRQRALPAGVSARVTNDRDARRPP